MNKTTWDSRFRAWFNWYNSGAGPYFNGGEAWPYHLKNYNFANNTAYARDGSKMVTLSEGQSYGMLYAVMGDDVKAFNAVYGVLYEKHRLIQDLIQTSKNVVVDGTPGWPDGWADFVNKDGEFILDDRGANPDLQIYGWVWSEDYGSGAAPEQQGIASIYSAPDGEIVAAGCLLMAYERWNVPEWKTDALAILADAVEYCNRLANNRYAWTMGQYRFDGGFTVPSPQTVSLGSGTVFPDTDGILFSTADLTQGDQVRFWISDGGTMPGGLDAQDAEGEEWPVYYLGINDSFNASFYPTYADAIGETNKIDITSTGSGTMYVYPYKQQAGQIATNPSYLFAPFFRLFAKYDTTNAAIWDALADSVYVDIAAGYDLNYWHMSPYLVGVNIADGTNAKFRSGGDSAAHTADSFRVSLNLAFDNSEDALDLLKEHAEFNEGTGKWVPKAGAAGGIWRFYVQTGFLPFQFGAQPLGGTLVDGDINTTTNRIDMGVDWLAAADHSSTNPVRFIGADLPDPLTSTAAVYPRRVDFNTYTFHPSRADAAAGTNTIDITDVGTGDRSWAYGWVSTVDVSSNVFTLSDEAGAFLTGEVLRIVPGGGTIATGLNASTSYYGRLRSKNTYSLHASEADANNNVNLIDVTALGSGELVMTKTSATVGWYYRSTINDTTEISPYGASQVLAYIYRLNGYTDAETFYQSLPDWLKQQGNGSFVENNGDYYIQHALGWMAGIMSDRARARTVGRQYIVFGDDELSDANALQTQIAQALGVAVYATVLKDAVSGDYAVPVVGVNAWDALSPEQQSSTVKVLPTGQWRANV